MNKIYTLPDDQFKSLVASSTSYSEVLTSLGLSPSGGTSSKLLKRRIGELGISTDHFVSPTTKAHAACRTPLKQILVENSPYTNSSRLKIRLVREGHLKYECVECGLGGVWNGKPISLHLDHINGVHNDHRLINLRFLCPNCHSQTDTYAGRNKQK